MAQPKTTQDNKNMSSEVAEIFKKYEERIDDFNKNVVSIPVKNNNIMRKDWIQLRPQIYKHMQSCYQLMHGSVISLAYNFLQIKKDFGTEIEKKLYSQMTLSQFFHRLATKRCVVFFQHYDCYTLRNGYNDSGNWEFIGTSDEEKQNKYDVRPELKPKLSTNLSYDELLISALCGISSKTHFINNGDRNNGANMNKKDKFYPLEAIYMGLVGARFERDDIMEKMLMIVDREQNVQQKGYGSYEKDEKENKEAKENDPLSKAKKTANIPYSKVIWRAFESFYNRAYFPKYDEIKKAYLDNKNEKIKNRYYEKNVYAIKGESPFLDKDIFKQRIRISLELFLFDADHRAQKAKKDAFCHIVGLGTGVWSFKKSIQDAIIAEVTLDIIKNTNLPHIKCVYFSWMDDSVKKVFDDDSICDISGNKICIQVGKRCPADKLQEPFDNCLIVAMYAWDSNAFPGNEYYHGMLSASGDPAAACASTISFVQNSMINKEYINGKNTAIYFYNPETHKYEFYTLGQIDFEQNPQKWIKKSKESKQQLIYDK